MTEPKYFAGPMLRGTLRERVDMAKYTSWRAGGTAERMYQPADLDDLQAFLRSVPDDEPLYAVGLGSNLLVRDGGLHGTVLLMHGTLNALRREDDGSLYCETGVPGAKLARFAALHDLQGAEFFAGIPGTLGGMLAMNAGCYGSETWERVLRVQTVDRRGAAHMRTPADYEIGYRHVLEKKTKDTRCKIQESSLSSCALPLSPDLSEFFVAAWLGFETGVGDVARIRIKALLNKRIASQPLHQPNAGSVFRNPPGDHAARLIEQCGLKGRQIGGARVSEKHANFIVNAGDATAADIENLINEVQAAVTRQTGVGLQCEVRIIGEYANSL